MARADLTTLTARRDDRELKFAQKCLTSDRFSKCLTLKEETATGNSREYLEQFARSRSTQNNLTLLNKGMRSKAKQKTYKDRSKRDPYTSASTLLPWGTWRTKWSWKTGISEEIAD